jgi:hypothetical protein
VPLGSILFKVRIVDQHVPRTGLMPLFSGPFGGSLLPAGETARRYRKAFISYASPDRGEVLKRVQMLRLARIRYFQDVLRLEPGDRWQRFTLWATRTGKRQELRRVFDRSHGDRG